MFKNNLPNPRPSVRNVPVYKQGAKPSPSGYKLSSNENPNPPFSELLSRAEASLRDINRYPDAEHVKLREKIADKFGVNLESIHIGAGSVSILYQIIQAFCQKDDEYVFAWRSFEAYPFLGRASEAKAIHVKNREDYGHDIEAIIEATNNKTKVIILCSPNNPTGNVISKNEFEFLMKKVSRETLVVLDEAYCEFVTDKNAAKGEDYFAKYSNLLILRTFSKAYGLAGLRIGYAIGQEEILASLKTMAIPLSITNVAAEAAVSVLDHSNQEMLNNNIEKIINKRNKIIEIINSYGIDLPEAQGNFVWIPSRENTSLLAEIFINNDIAVRIFDNEGVRVSIGEEESIVIIENVIRQYCSILRSTS